MVSPFLLKRGCAVLCALAMSLSTAGQPLTASAAPRPKPTLNAIQLENQKAGTPAWQIGLSPYVNSNDTDQWIRGYASAVSINKGEKITFNITVNRYNWKTDPILDPLPKYTIDVYRIGWYGGLGGRLMKHLGPFSGVSQPGGTSPSGGTGTIDPCGVTTYGAADYASTGIIACRWGGDGLGNGSYTLDTSLNPDGSTTPDWTSGIYVALLTTDQVRYPTQCGATPCDPDHQSYIIFAIREDGRVSQMLYQQPVASYIAYNNYPNDTATGKNVYDGGSFGPLTSLGTERAVKVSLDRPYTYPDGTGAGEFLHWEVYFIRWMEQNGYDVTYTTDLDTHLNGASLLQHKVVLLAGHSEYWSHEMRQAFEAARDAGVSLAFFGANPVYFQVRFEPSATGTPNRVLTCYKEPNLDPYSLDPSTSALTTVPFRNYPLSIPEQTLVGSMYADYFDAAFPALPYVVQNSTNWVYAGTGLYDGSSIPGILGYEQDKYFDYLPGPVADPTTYVLLSDSPFTGANGANYSNASIYEAPSGAWVFDAATLGWSWGLDSYVPPAGIVTWGVAAPSAAVKQITANVLNKFLIQRPPSLSKLTGSAATGTIQLTWSYKTANQTGFQVERSTDAVGFGILETVGPTSTSYVDAAALPGYGYYYRVTAVNAGGNSPYSNVVQVGTPPVAPNSLAAIAISTSEIDLHWNDTSNNELGFYIERSTNNKGFTRIASTLPDVNSYKDTGLSAGKTYYYHVMSYNLQGTSSYTSATVSTPK